MAKPLTQPHTPLPKEQVSVGGGQKNIEPSEEELDSRNQGSNDALTSCITTDSFFVEDILDDHMEYISNSYADTIAFYIDYSTKGCHLISDEEWLYDDNTIFPTKLYYLEQLIQRTPINSSPRAPVQLPITSNSHYRILETITDEDLVHFMESKPPASVKG